MPPPTGRLSSLAPPRFAILGADAEAETEPLYHDFATCCLFARVRMKVAGTLRVPATFIRMRAGRQQIAT